MPWSDRELETRYSFGRLLLKRLPRSERDPIDLDGEVDLHSYRLARIGETNVVLQSGVVGEVRGPSAVGSRQQPDVAVPLHEIIDRLNERFGTDFQPADQLLFDQIIADGVADPQVRARANANSFANFALAIKGTLDGLMIDRMERNSGIVTKYLNESDFERVLAEYLMRQMYEASRKTGS